MTSTYRALPVLAAAACLLAGCSATALGDLASLAGVGGSAGNGPDGTVSPPRVAGSTSECYQGTWRLRPETAWSSENLASMGIGGDADFEYVGSDGDAWITFQPSGTYEWSLNRFAVTLRGNASSSPTDVTVNMHGMLYGTAVPGSSARTIDMHHGADGTPETRLTAFANVAGGGVSSLGRINLNAERIIGDARWTSTYRCNGNELVISTEDESSGALQNATYTRVR